MVTIKSSCRKKAVVYDQLPHLHSSMVSLKWAATPRFIVPAGRGFVPVLFAGGGTTPDGGRQSEGGGFVFVLKLGALRSDGQHTPRLVLRFVGATMVSSSHQTNNV